MAPALTNLNSKESATARVLGSGTSGIAELLVFHPVDTIAKRLMSNTTAASMSSMSSIIFREHAAAPLGRRLMSLFPGLGYAAGYKVAQRVYKFGGQPYFNDIISANYRAGFTDTFGERWGKIMMQGAAGSYVVGNYAVCMLTDYVAVFQLDGNW